MARKQQQFALVGPDNEVKQVIEAFSEYIEENPAEDFLLNGEDGVQRPAGPGHKWVETSMDGSVTKHYAGIGHEFHEDLGEFVPKKQFPSWIRDDEKAEWKAPKEKPKVDEEFQKWNESEQKWEVDEVMKQKDAEAKAKAK